MERKNSWCYLHFFFKLFDFLLRVPRLALCPVWTSKLSMHSVSKAAKVLNSAISYPVLSLNVKIFEFFKVLCVPWRIQRRYMLIEIVLS